MSHDIIQPLKICDIDKGFQRKCRIKPQTCFFMLHRRANMNIYDLDFDTMLHILKELKKSYDIELARLEVAVSGHLTGTHRHGRQNYLQTEIIDGKYFRHGLSKDPDTLRQLCRKAYLKEALLQISDNIKC